MMRPDTNHLFALRDVLGSDHDLGLEHNHHWARECAGAGRQGPLVADASAMRTPSSVLHDDAIYAAG